MFKALLPLIILLFFNNINAQSELDSLRELSKILILKDRVAYFKVSDRIIEMLKKNKNDSLLVQYYLSRSMMYQMGNEYQKALEYNDSVLQYKNIPVRFVIRASMGKAEMMWKLNYPMIEVFDLLNRSKDVAEEIGDSVQISSIYYRYSSIYLERGNYTEAIKALKKASEIRPKKLWYPKVKDISKLSNLFLKIGNIKKARFYFDKALSMAKDANYKIVNRQLAVLGGLLAKKKGDYVIADSLFEVALNSYKLSKSESDIFNTYVLLLELGFERGDKSKINKYWQLANDSFKDALDEGVKAKFHLISAKINLKRKRYKLVDLELKSAKNIINDIHNLLFEIEYTRLLAEFEKESGNYSQSLMLNEEYHKLSDSLKQFQSEQLVLDIEEKYQTKEKQKQIELLEANNALIGTKLEQEKLEKYLILGGAAVGLLFLLFLGITYFKVKEKNKLIEKTLKQKDFLLKEIHHRVKNNLQLITSLLNLQSRYIKDKKAKEVSLDGKNRVRAMSLIHQFLYQKDNYVNLELAEYFERLLIELFEAYHVEDGRIDVDFDIEKIEVDVDRVIPLGLIFNELITNILKYAFPDDRSGTIDISLKKIDSNLLFNISDDGVGFDDFDAMKNENSFGFTLIEALLQKWNGKFEIYTENGTQAKVTIPFD